jgi:hypothetical protein
MLRPEVDVDVEKDLSDSDSEVEEGGSKITCLGSLLFHKLR